MKNHIIKWMETHLNEKQRQWAWFIILWCFGFLSVVTLGAVIKLIMKL